MGAETGAETRVGMGARTRAGTNMGTRTDVRVGGREGLGTYKVVKKVGRETREGGATPTINNQQPQPQDRRIMRGTRAQGRKERNRIG